ncbi:hypothetical protein E4U48_002030 [Claviceps purpurea]|nr:hypothetical protein E4U48_002030 [Claviceps purpurea]
MPSQDPADRPVSPGDDTGLPSGQYASMDQRPASVVSSRISDVGGEKELGTKHVAQPRGTETASRPGTAQTLASSRATARLSQVGRKGIAAAAGVHPNRGSIASTTASGRASTLTTRSHAPALTSGAFFRPLSSQKLQAQRAPSARPVPVNQQLQHTGHTQANIDDDQTDMGDSVIDGSPGDNNRNVVSPHRRVSGAAGSMRPPPSRGTEVTDQETFGRMTASPSTGRRHTGSMSESMRPLQNKRGQSQDLHIKVDRSYRDANGPPSPSRSPRSFRSSFLLQGKAELGQGGRHRSVEGAEKLSSTASSPRFARMNSQSDARPSLSTATAARAKEEASTGKIHQYFEGNTVFCLGGRFQNTKHTPINVVTGLFLVVPCALFFGFEAPWLWENISPAVPIVFAYLTFICLSSFMHASASNPGILPRNLHRFPPTDDDDDPLRLAPPRNGWILVRSAEPTTAAMEVPVKYCRTCNIWRPPRAHHCRLCDNCIEGHDHHCVWLNNCVGKRNYRYFFTFVSSATILSAYLIGTSLTQLLVYMQRQEISFGESIDHFRVPFALVLLGLLCFIYPGGLMGYHLFLMSRGETTRELIFSHKFAKEERFRAYSQGTWLRNLTAVLCRPRPPAYYRFKSKYTTGDQRLGMHREGMLDVKHDSHPGVGVEMENVRRPGTSATFQGPAVLRN